MIGVSPRLHANEVHTDVHLVRRLLAEQFPQWDELPIERVPSAGSDHVLYRLGGALVARLPRKERVDEQVDKERKWLPRLAPQLPVALPVPVAKGKPGNGYPFFWSVYSWLEGENPPADGIGDASVATDLAGFIDTLQRIDPAGGPPAGEQNFFRGAPLAVRDDPVRAALAALAETIDTDAAATAWDSALNAPPWPGPPVWIHGDLTPENVLVRGGRLSAVIDFGCLGVGDPACDLMVAWTVLSAEARAVFRAGLDADEATWDRGCGWALSTGLIALPYYKDTNPPRAANARYRIGEVLTDLQRRR
jgi:aminoglycoside phosphotransferase (APT) family kinase protein